MVLDTVPSLIIRPCDASGKGSGRSATPPADHSADNVCRDLPPARTWPRESGSPTGTKETPTTSPRGQQPSRASACLTRDATGSCRRTRRPPRSELARADYAAVHGSPMEHPLFSVAWPGAAAADPTYEPLVGP